MTRIVLIEDHAMVREGLRAILEADPDVEVIGEASDGREGVDLIVRTKPDIAVLDIGMPRLNGVEATRQITRDHPAVRVIALSMHTERQFVISMFEAGASGYVAKESAGEELMRAIRAVQRGRKYLSAEVAGVLVEGVTRRTQDGAEGKLESLSARERQVLQLLAEGYTSGEIAEELGVSTATVDTHRRNIMKKTDRHTVADLTKYAIRVGLTSL